MIFHNLRAMVAPQGDMREFAPPTIFFLLVCPPQIISYVLRLDQIVKISS